MKRTIYTIVACAAFLAMLTGTSKKKKLREVGSIPKLTIPDSTGWTRNEVAGIRFASPPNSVIERADQLAGVHIKFPSGEDFTFMPTAIDLSTRAREEFHMYFEPDAHILLSETGYTDYCIVTACTTVPIMGSPLCMHGDSSKHEDCAQIVALVRSIQPR